MMGSSDSSAGYGSAIASAAVFTQLKIELQASAYLKCLFKFFFWYAIPVQATC